MTHIAIAAELDGISADWMETARANGLSETELAEVMTHLAFYAGWPRAVSAVLVAKEVFKKELETTRSSFLQY